MKDPVVEAVREVREKHAAKFKHNLSAICADLKKIEKKYTDRLVSLPSRRSEKVVVK